MHDHTELIQDRIGHLKERLEREITEKICPLPVSYTHLTLPTSDLV